MESAKQLSKQILDFQSNAITGGFVDSKELGGAIADIAKQDPNAPPLAKFLGSLGDGSGIVAVMRAWQYRDQIQGYQTAHNISSVEWDSVEWLGETIRFPNYCDQLAFMPQDKAILSRHKNNTVRKYLDFIQRHNFTMILENDDGEETDILDSETVLKYSTNYDYAYLRSGWCNQPVLNGDSPGKEVLYYLSDYPLYLSDFPNDKADEKMISIVAKTEVYP